MDGNEDTNAWLIDKHKQFSIVISSDLARNRLLLFLFI